jgi:FkbM family methyltransferase
MQLRRTLRQFKRLVNEGDMSSGFRWLLPTLRRQMRTIPVHVRGDTVHVRTLSPDVEVALSCLCGEFEEVVKSVPRLRHGVIVDAGGYIGTAAIAFAKAYPDALVLCLEPSAENFSLLRRNVEPYPNIRAIQMALSDDPGVLELKDRGTGQWGFTIVKNPADKGNAISIGEVECTTVDRLLEKFSKTGIDIFKIDIEGGEHQLLTHSAGWLLNTTAICIELHDRIVPGCTEAFNRATSGRRNRKLDGEKYLSLAV